MYIARSIPIRIHSDKSVTPSESRSLGSGGGKCICYRRIVSSSAVRKKKKKESQKDMRFIDVSSMRHLRACLFNLGRFPSSFPQPAFRRRSRVCHLDSVVFSHSRAALSSSKLELVLPLSNPQCRRPRWYRARWEEGIRVVAFPACAAASFRLMSARY